MRVEVVVPFTGSCPHRLRALNWVRGRYPWPVTIATAPAGPWCKAAAVMPAVSNCSADVVVVADADVWTAGITAAVAAVGAGEPWAVPHHDVRRLTEDATTAVLAGAAPQEQPLVERAYRGMEGGGIVVATKLVLESIPLDPRFIGWGQEDAAWGIALHHTAGPAWRGTDPLYHLFHPPQPRLSRRYGSDASANLWRRYVRARSSPAAMQSLIEEARCSAT